MGFATVGQTVGTEVDCRSAGQEDAPCNTPGALWKKCLTPVARDASWFESRKGDMETKHREQRWRAGGFVSASLARSRLDLISRSAGGTLVAAGMVVLVAWAVGPAHLGKWWSAGLVMNPITALLFLMAGLPLLTQSREEFHAPPSMAMVRFILGGIVALIGGLKLLDSLGGFGLRIDELLFPLRTGRTLYQEMAPNTALNFLLCGLGLVLLDKKTRHGFLISQGFIIAATVITLMALVGHSYQVWSLFRVGTAIPMTLNTALGFAILCLALLAARPEQGIMRLLTSRTDGGAIARRLLPVALLFPWILGAALYWAEERGYVTSSTAISIFAVSTIVIFTGLIWWNAKLLYLVDLDRKRTARRLAVQHTASRVLAEVRPPAEAMRLILRSICETLGWQLGLMWTTEPSTNRLCCSQTWPVNDNKLKGLIQASHEMVLAPGEGFPGKAAARGRMIWSRGNELDGNSNRARLADRAGLRSGFAFPIRLGKETPGVCEFFSLREEPPDEDLREVLLSIGTQVGQFLERVRAEEQVRQTSAELARSNADLQQFAFLASHDLSEPLRMVSSYLKLLEPRCKDSLDPQAREFITRASDGAARMQALINDLLAYSRVDSRGRDFNTLDVSQGLQAAEMNLSVAIQEAGAVVTHDALPEVRGDAIQISQLFQNLIGNAIRFRGSEPPRIHVGARRAGAEVVFSVADNGIGIERKNFDRIFVIFQRLHTRSEYPGTGMGLAICKRIVERHGGRIWVESEPGKGSTFFFTLAPANNGSNSV